MSKVNIVAQLNKGIKGSAEFEAIRTQAVTGFVTGVNATITAVTEYDNVNGEAFVKAGKAVVSSIGYRLTGNGIEAKAKQGKPATPTADKVLAYVNKAKGFTKDEASALIDAIKALTK